MSAIRNRRATIIAYIEARGYSVYRYGGSFGFAPPMGDEGYYGSDGYRLVRQLVRTLNRIG